MEPAEDRLDDHVDHHPVVRVAVTAMEPAGTGWTTGQIVATAEDQTAPQWSQPRIGWMTLRGRGLGCRVRRTAMEPAEDQPDDEKIFKAPESTLEQPQWSQPGIGWKTGGHPEVHRGQA